MRTFDRLNGWKHPRNFTVAKFDKQVVQDRPGIPPATFMHYDRIASFNSRDHAEALIRALPNENLTLWFRGKIVPVKPLPKITITHHNNHMPQPVPPPIFMDPPQHPRPGMEVTC